MTAPLQPSQKTAKFPSYVDAVLRHAAHDSFRPAIGTSQGVLSYGQLAQAVASAISTCARVGISKGDVVGLIVSDPVWHITLICALHRLGAVSISLSANETALKLGIDVLLCDGERPSHHSGQNEAVDAGWFTTKTADFSSLPTVSPGRTELCRIALSSGTTGRPKAIAMSSEIIWHRLTTYALRGRFGQSEKVLCGPQLRSHFGFAVVFSALMNGKMVCFADSADLTVPIVSYFGADLAVISVHQLSELANVQKQHYGGLSTLREIQAGGATIAGSLYTKIRSNIACPVLNTYASTEAGTAALGSIDMLGDARNNGAVGYLVPWADVVSCDDDGKPLPPNTFGHLRVAALGMAPLYKLGMTHVDEPQHFFPGDFGRITAERLLFIEGRSNDLINIGGNKVAPESIEQIVLDYNGVKEAAAFSVNTLADLPQIWVVIVADGPVDPKDIIRHFAERSRVIVPGVIKIVESIPRSVTGKISYDQLRKQLTEDHAEDKNQE